MSRTVPTRWVLQYPNGQFAANLLECSEEWAWIVGCMFGPVMPSDLTEEHRRIIAQKKADNFSVVEVMLIPVSEANGR